MITYIDESGNVVTANKPLRPDENYTAYEVTPLEDKTYREAWEIVNGELVINEAKSNEIFIKQATDMLQDKANVLAQSWGYDDINSIAKYAARGNSPFNAEAVLLGDYMDAIWVYGLGVLGAWQAGGAKPTLESILSGLPTKPVKP